MRLDTSYDPTQIPERQHHLRLLPSSEQVDHPELKDALQHYEQSRAQELSKRRDATAAEQALPDAENADALALADAQAQGAKDPGDKHRQKALSKIAEGRRQHAAAKITLARSLAAVATALDKHCDEWQAALVDERDQLRGAMGELLDGWERLWGQLQRNSANRALARGSGSQSPSLFASSFSVPIVRDGSMIQVADVLSGLRDLAKPERPKSGAVENVEIGADATRRALPEERDAEREAVEQA